MSEDRPSSYGASYRRDNPRALWSMILGFVSVPLTAVNFLGGVLGVAAVILGWRARHLERGRWLAIGGIATGGFSVAITMVILVLLGTGVINPPKP